MMKSAPLCLALACLAAGPAIAQGETRPEVVAFSASVRVDVDAAGKPLKVEAPADLPEAIRNYVETRVATWQYQPANVAGVPQAATTYVSVNACAVPAGSGYRMGVDFDGNGPRRANDQRFVSPKYPIAAEIAGTQAEFTLILNLHENGSAAIDAFERSDIAGRGGRTDFRKELERWVKTIRFDLEQVAGRPVATQVRMPVSFKLNGASDVQQVRDELQVKARASRECQAAADDGASKPVAMAPAVTVIPTPAS